MAGSGGRSRTSSTTPFRWAPNPVTARSSDATSCEGSSTGSMTLSTQSRAMEWAPHDRAGLLGSAMWSTTLNCSTRSVNWTLPASWSASRAGKPRAGQDGAAGRPHRAHPRYAGPSLLCADRPGSKGMRQAAGAGFVLDHLRREGPDDPYARLPKDPGQRWRASPGSSTSNWPRSGTSGGRTTQVGVRGPEQMRPPFRRFGEDYRATGRFHACLDRLKATLADPTGDRIVESMRLARDVGGTDLGRLLRTLSGFLREDARLRPEREQTEHDPGRGDGQPRGVDRPALPGLQLRSGERCRRTTPAPACWSWSWAARCA
jgi:hypothetical protein